MKISQKVNKMKKNEREYFLFVEYIQWELLRYSLNKNWTMSQHIIDCMVLYKIKTNYVRKKT